MKFSRLRKEGKLYWPSEIDISDGILHENGGARFTKMVEIEERSSDLAMKINEWNHIFSWSIYVGFHHLAKERLKSNQGQTIKYTEIDWAVVESHFFRSLDPSDNQRPRVFRSQYINDL